jgi:hypothetical protein
MMTVEGGERVGPRVVPVSNLPPKSTGIQIAAVPGKGERGDAEQMGSSKHPVGRPRRSEIGAA